MTYQLKSGGGVIRLADGASIPPDPANRDYREYLQWAQANTAQLAPGAVRPAQPFQVARPAGVARAYYERSRVYG